MEVLILRFDAPLMSFGAPIVDRHGVIQPYPALSMMAGLLGNALGIVHGESEQLARLQERIQYASRQDRRGRQIRDYQTVDLSKSYMNDDRAWTTRGELETRKGGAASSGTHIRLRDYWADAVHTIALTVEPADEAPTLDDLEEALRFPARPLFIGRKTCLPASPIFVRRMPSDDVLSALRETPLAPRAERRDMHPAWWPVHPDAKKLEDASVNEDARRPVTDRRDWANQIHTGQRWVATGEIKVTAVE